MDKITKIILISFITNIFLSIIKIFFGFIGKAGALVADGIHSLSDTFTDIFAIVGSKISKRPADFKHPLGHGKAEYITCMFIGIVIIFMGLIIVYNGIFKERIVPSLYVAVITLITILLKLVLSTFLLRKGKTYKSEILISSGKESFSDVISSVVVLISVLLSQLGKVHPIFAYSDAVAMLLVGALIIKIGYNILKENISNLLGQQVTDEAYITKIDNIINKHKEIKSIDRLIIMKEGPFYKLDIEVGMDKNMKLKHSHDIVHIIEKEIKEYDSKVKYIIIHTNPY